VAETQVIDRLRSPLRRLFWGLGFSIPSLTLLAMETPCERICVVDQASGLCRGCGRSLAEIGGWTAYSDGERARIMAELPKRLDALNTRTGSGRQG
jgi:predicted Fe-S protein YdhL (DUF1289 family)